MRNVKLLTSVLVYEADLGFLQVEWRWQENCRRRHRCEGGWSHPSPPGTCLHKGWRSTSSTRAGEGLSEDVLSPGQNNEGVRVKGGLRQGWGQRSGWLQRRGGGEGEKKEVQALQSQSTQGVGFGLGSDHKHC